MTSYMLRCKNCGGFVAEEEIFVDDNDNTIMQIGCYVCYHKAYIKISEWKNFKKKLLLAVKK